MVLYFFYLQERKDKQWEMTKICRKHKPNMRTKFEQSSMTAEKGSVRHFFWGGGGGGGGWVGLSPKPPPPPPPPPPPRGVGGLERQRRRRLRKRHLQSKTSHAAFGFKLYRSSFMSCNSSNVGNIFHSWILTDCIKVQEKKKKVAVLRSDPPENVKLGIFASLGSRAVTTRKVKKSVMHVQSFCIANLNLLLSSCSRWRRRRRCFLSSLIVIQFPYVFSVIFKES